MKRYVDGYNFVCYTVCPKILDNIYAKIAFGATYIVAILHCNGNSVYIFLFWELRGLSPNFHIHVSVSD